MQNPNKGPPGSYTAQNKDLLDMEILCTFNMILEGQNLGERFIKAHLLYSDHDQDGKLQSGTLSILQVTPIHEILL